MLTRHLSGQVLVKDMVDPYSDLVVLLHYHLMLLNMVMVVSLDLVVLLNQLLKF